MAAQQGGVFGVDPLQQTQARQAAVGGNQRARSPPLLIIAAQESQTEVYGGQIPVRLVVLVVQVAVEPPKPLVDLGGQGQQQHIFFKQGELKAIAQLGQRQHDPLPLADHNARLQLLGIAATAAARGFGGLSLVVAGLAGKANDPLPPVAGDPVFAGEGKVV